MAATLPAAAASRRLLEALRASGALLEGHFLLSSGRHAGRYVQCARLLQHPERAAEACAGLAACVRAGLGSGDPVELVAGPALGAVTLAYELARALGVRGLFAERDAGGSFVLRRGFQVGSGERVLLAEDVVTTGGSVRELVPMLEAAGARVVAVAGLVNRSGQAEPFQPLPFFRLADLEIPSWEPGDCELCRSGAGAPVKPGSRPPQP